VPRMKDEVALAAGFGSVVKTRPAMVRARVELKSGVCGSKGLSDSVDQRGENGRTATSTKPGTPAGRPRLTLPRAILTSARGEEALLGLLLDFLPLAFLLEEDFLLDLPPFLPFEVFLA
jgi:hypothetical protein